MPSAADYEQRITTYDWEDLRNLWQGITVGETPGWDPGKAMEYLVLRSFQLDGALVRWPYAVREDGEEIEQIDGVIYFESIAGMIECKDTDKATNIEPVAKLRNQLLRRPGGIIGIVFSRNGFTESALTLARFIAPHTILLWNGPEIAHILRQESICQPLLVKYHHCIEVGLPDYDIRTGGTR